MLDALRPKAAEVSSLLDIGGGVGVILHELLDGSAMEASFVEIASAYLQVAREEAEKHGYRGRVQFVQGDFVALAGKIADAELVTLDRVVCCYPDAEPLIKSSASKALKWYALSYPRDRWWVRLAIRFENWRRRRGGDSFQVHIHSEILMDELVKRAGFSRQFHARTLTWSVAIYRRHNVT
jgi:magnesium-protoporphyrin O-methyltransferase